MKRFDSCGYYKDYYLNQWIAHLRNIDKDLTNGICQKSFSESIKSKLEKYKKIMLEISVAYRNHSHRNVLEDLEFKDQVEDTLCDDDVKAVHEASSKDLQLQTPVASRLPIKLPPHNWFLKCVAKLNKAELLNLKKSIAVKKPILLPYRDP